MNILMVAAENDSLPGGKVGGIGDVVRVIPEALGKLIHLFNVVVPSYGVFSKLPQACYETSVSVNFSDQIQNIELVSLQLPDQT